MTLGNKRNEEMETVEGNAIIIPRLTTDPLLDTDLFKSNHMTVI